MPKYVVLKTLPQGQRPGELVDLPVEAGNVFLLVEAVRAAVPSDDNKSPEKRLTYRRRDLVAESSNG